MSTAVITIFAVTAVIAIAISILLINAARQSGQARLNLQKRLARQEYLDSSVASDEQLSKVLLEEVHEVIDSEKAARDISQRLNQVFGKELEKRVTLASQQIENKYDAVIKEKSINEEMAWKKYDKVLTEKKNTDAVIRSIAEGLVVVNAKGKVIMMNPAAEKILGSSSREKMGRSLEEGVQEDQLLSLVRTADDPDKKEIELVSPEDETKRIIRASSAVIENEDGQTVGMVSVLSDITKQKELDRMKTMFVASVSHELRTPLVAIDKSISLILSKATGPLSTDQEQFLGIADRNLKRLSRLINDLLDLSKLEAGRMTLKAQQASMEKVIADTIETLATWANAKAVSLKASIEPSLPQASFDPDRITQVLTNLIGNSIKFTPEGGTVTVSASRIAGFLEVRVRDTGIGIQKESLGKVFDKFYQVGERVSTDISGTGIGLAIAKEIVELHGGKIWAESDYGQGASFIFTLPLA